MSLVEIIVILVLIGVVSIPLARLAHMNLFALGRYTVLTRAQYDVQSIVERIMVDFVSRGSTGYAYVVSNWSGDTGSTNSGFSYSVTVGGELTKNGVKYRLVTVNLTGNGISGMKLDTWISN
jgi:hypothetical protein